MTLRDANRLLDDTFGGDYGISPIRFAEPRPDNPAVRRAIIAMRRQASPTTPQERHEGPSEFIRAFLVMVLLVAAGVSLVFAVTAYRMGAA